MSTATITSYVAHDVARTSSFEVVSLFSAAGLALSAMVVSMLPIETVAWALAQIG
jgi:hypothetical protein